MSATPGSAGWPSLARTSARLARTCTTMRSRVCPPRRRWFCKRRRLTCPARFLGELARRRLPSIQPCPVARVETSPFREAAGTPPMVVHAPRRAPHRPKAAISHWRLAANAGVRVPGSRASGASQDFAAGQRRTRGWRLRSGGRTIASRDDQGAARRGAAGISTKSRRGHSARAGRRRQCRRHRASAVSRRVSLVRTTANAVVRRRRPRRSTRDAE